MIDDDIDVGQEDVNRNCDEGVSLSLRFQVELVELFVHLITYIC